MISVLKMKKCLIAFLMIVSAMTLFAQQGLKECESLIEQNRLLEAKILADTILASAPQSQEARFLLAWACYMENRVAEAAGVLKPLAEKDFVYPAERFGVWSNANVLMAKLRYLQYDFSQSIALIEELVKGSDSVSDEVVMLYRHSLIGKRMLTSYDDIEFLDSIVVDEIDVLRNYPQNENVGYFSYDGDTQSFVSGRGDVMISSIKDTLSKSFDLFWKEQYLDGWGEYERLRGEINTEADEISPFLMSDGLTLYFSSNDSNSLGGYDIFVSTKNSEGDFLRPINIGLPFSSPYNDYFLVIDEEKSIGYFASDRFQAEGKVAIYAFRYKNRYEKLNLDQDSIDAPRLISPHFSQSKTIFSAKTEKDSADPTIAKQFSFAITSTMIYYKYDDFHSPEALAKYMEYESLQRDIADSNRQLNEGRKQYAELADEIERTALGKTILQEEYRLIKLKQQAETLSREIRELEIREWQN